jgi:homopolymeric O-antigen transport system ATP-binding protein
MAPVIEVHKLSKKYRLGTTVYKFDRMTEFLMRWIHKHWHSLRSETRQPKSEQWIWGLDDVSFDVPSGEVVGVIGANGAGKSTLLKVLSRITDPTSGHVWLHGRASSLLEVGTGFHPDLTGRENIFLNGSILGMSKSEVSTKLDEIVAFSEIGKFLDTPVKRYSSGMFVRLAFAVAAHLEPEILIVDEVLAVGDMAFQKKCLGKMGDASRAGRTVLFVSHNLAMLQNLCHRGLVLQKGKLVYDGPTQRAIDFYVHSVFGAAKDPGNHIIDLSANGKRAPQFGVPRLMRLAFTSREGVPVTEALPYGSSLQARIELSLHEPVREADVLLSFNSLFGTPVFVANSGFDPACITEELEGEVTFVCDIPSFSLVPGEYMVNVALAVRDKLLDCVEDVARITVMPTDYYRTGRVPRHGSSVLMHNWSMHASNTLVQETAGMNSRERNGVAKS